MTEQMETIGCDLGDKQSELCILLPNGKIERPGPVKTTRPAMRAFFTRARAHVVIEVGTHSRWVSELLKGVSDTEVTVANPRRVKLISKNDSKDDRNDAELLARLGRADKQLLAPIEHRGNQAQADLAVTKARDALVRCRTKLINSGPGPGEGLLVNALPACTTESFHKKARSAVPAELKTALDPIFWTLGALTNEIKSYGSPARAHREE